MTANSKPTLLLLNPHPDDESIGCGGLLSSIMDNGGEAVVVTCTGGEMGECHIPGVDGPEELAAVRRDEMERAMKVLGVQSIEWLGYRDSGMVDTEGNDDPRSFHQADLTEATDRLLDLIRRYEPQVIITQAANGLYGHPDHIKAHYVAVAAFERSAELPNPPQKLYYVTMPYSNVRRIAAAAKAVGLEDGFAEMDIEVPPIGVPDDQVTLALDMREYAERKEQALMEHASQMSGSAFWNKLPREDQLAIIAHEYFTLAGSRVRTPENETSVFDGIPGLQT